MDDMETVIDRLSEIEGAAVHLEEMAADEKKQIAARYEQKTREFDQVADVQTQEKLKALQEKLKTEAEDELRKMRQETERELQEMEEDYSQNHKKLAARILKQIIGE